MAYCRVTSLSVATCVDKSPHCGRWAIIGECTKNPGYMLTSCCVWCNHVKSTYSKTKYNFLILANTIAGRDNAAKFFVSLKQNNSEGFIGAP